MTIEDLIKEQIDQLDITGLVREEIRRLISDDTKRSITKVVNDEIQKIIKTEIDIVMSKGVQTDDGWGKKESYTSFESLFKSYFKTALDNSYQVKSTIQSYMKSECDKLVKDQTTQIVTALKKSLETN